MYLGPSSGGSVGYFLCGTLGVWQRCYRTCHDLCVPHKLFVTHLPLFVSSRVWKTPGTPVHTTHVIKV